MSTSVLIVALVLAGQVSAPNERYPYPAGGTWGPVDANGVNSGGNSAPGPGGGVVPAGNSSRQQSNPQNGNPGEPYSVAPQNNSGPPLYPAAGPDLRPGAAGQSSRASNGLQYGNATQPGNVGSLSAEEEAVGLKPSEMIRAMLAAPHGSRLAGRPVTLAEVLRGASSRQQQTERVDAYWDLCSSVADYYLGLREQEELRRLRALVPRVGSTWQEAESELGVRIGTSQRAAVASQLRLASFLGRNDPNLWPLPADIPHCGDYHTRYDEVFAGRSSSEAEQLRDLLPLRYEELKDAATAVTRSEEWVDRVATQRSDNSDGTGMLRSLELLALRRRAFVQIARDYNRRIARYTELAAPNQIDPEQLVAMLIKVNDLPGTADRTGAPASAGNRQSRTSTGEQQTFADDWAPSQRGGVYAPQRDEAVVPASAGEEPTYPAERSLLVTPQKP